MRRIPWGWVGAIACAVLVAAVAYAVEPLPKQPPIPPDNPGTPGKIELGKMLFFDPRLSATGTVSCNSCHNVMEAGEDDRPVSVGVDGKTGSRSAPTVWNAAYLSAQFWDGRAGTLEEQAKGPMVNPVEMGMPSHDVVVARIARVPGYRIRFAEVFGGATPIAIDNVARAIAAYERTLVTPGAPVDRYLKGDRNALSAAAVRGMKTFETLGCGSCHSGPVYAGPFTVPGQGFFQLFPAHPGSPYDAAYHLLDDDGRFQVTKAEDDRHLFRVAPLRNVALTAPYFHNGSVATLDEAVRVMAKTQLERDLTDAETAEVVAFLEGLTGRFPAQTLPRLPETPGRTLIE